jgi:uncharacterized protein YjbJ (UPF0337 family)
MNEQSSYNRSAFLPKSQKERTMSTATEHSLKGKFDQAAGKVKQAVGEATGNDNLANRGTAQQVKGHAEEAWGSVKGAAQEKAADRHVENEGKAHDVREKIASTAQNVKEKIQGHTDRR